MCDDDDLLLAAELDIDAYHAARERYLNRLNSDAGLRMLERSRALDDREPTESADSRV